MKNDFRNYAVHHLGMSSNTLDSYVKFVDANAGAVSMPQADYQIGRAHV